MRYNEEVAYNLGLSLEDLYVLEKVEDKIKDTRLSKYGDSGTFSFNQVDLFKICKFVFKQIKSSDTHDEIKKVYKTNNAKFNKMLKGPLGKILVKFKTIKTKNGAESYYRINTEIRTILMNGYPVVVDTELSDIENLICKELNLSSIGKNIRTQLKEMDINLLKTSINLAKENKILDYPYIKGIYNKLLENKKDSSAPTDKSITQKSDSLDINNIITQKNYFKTSKNKFRNFTETFNQYSEDELDKIIEKGQIAKYR